MTTSPDSSANRLRTSPRDWALFHSRRSMLLAAACMAATVGHTQTRRDGTYPTRPIHLIAPIPPGGPTDFAARALANSLARELGQPIVVENRPGAAGTLGTALVQQAPPDGYSLVMSTLSTQITGPLLVPKPPFDGVKDFTAIGGFMRMTVVLLVSQSVPAGSFKEFVAYAQQRPDKLNYGTPGIGSAPHLVTELIKDRTGIQITHIAYKGGAPMLQALVSDEVQLAVGDLTTSMAWIKAGKVKPLAVLSAQRSSLLPVVPTLLEEGVLDAPADFWIGLAGPAGMPPAITSQLHAALGKVLDQPDMREFFARSGAEPLATSPRELRDLWVMEQQRWADVIRTKHIRAE